MKLVFTKGPGKWDRLEISRPGRAPEQIECPKQGIIPHDMVHYAVEHTLDLRGFLRRVGDGEAATFQMQAEAQSDAVERLVEVIQGDQWSGGQSAPTEMLALYQLTCEARQCPALALDEAAILAIRAEIARLSAAWSAVPVGQSLSLQM